MKHFIASISISALLCTAIISFATFAFETDAAFIIGRQDSHSYVDHLRWYHKIWNWFLPSQIEFREAIFGVLTTTAGNNFPKNFLNPVDGDVIQAGDWRRIEYAIGSTTLDVSSSSNTTTSLYYLVTKASSIDPGHLHTSAGVSGTISIARGGTGTGTVPAVNQVLIGTSSAYTLTNAIPSCDTATSSKLLFTSSSQQWSCGTDFTIATSSESWQKLGETILAATNASASVAVASRAHYRIHISASTTGSGIEYLRLNNDAGANYANRFSLNNGADTAQNGDNIVYLTTSLSAASSTYSVIDIDGSNRRNKKLMILTTIDNNTTAPTSFQGYATWATTTQITTIALGIDANSFGSSTVVTVYGSNN